LPFSPENIFAGKRENRESAPILSLVRQIPVLFAEDETRAQLREIYDRKRNENLLLILPMQESE
jgi:hypothetical protein